ncbi:nucleotidyltransferase domain-containing protein [Nocardia jejuensis]|uniref:nucleotidyltransferase domain-containing protein n=1 Tax=Nocardia jejuensis TaxID=328049 RepID=UPI000ABE8144|nr:nucleotidyltransferase domain-containing protein [Nocardia jejuensis]
MVIDGVDVARQLVRRDFPQARAAWLGGSVALGIATVTSDLDITVLLAGSPAPYRASMRYGGWPVELFVQTENSLEHFRAAERAERRPSTLRLIGHSCVLLDADGSGAHFRESYAKQLASGPDPLTDNELRSARYRITDLLDDLIGSEDPAERLMIATTVWHAAADLLLIGNRLWTGSGKWLHRELAAFDRTAGTAYAETLANAVASVVSGADEPMVDVVTEVLDLFGGRLFDGYRVAGPTTV